ncbi:MAG: hypothetical protein ACRDDY_13335 [Clostridium sp.]|uniref:hypothetical protein n=1 Tax=Clostridium sp. TaxID=1506 RepID=UPI003EE7A70D
MGYEIIREVTPIIVTILMGIITYLVKVIGNSIIKYLAKKEEVLEKELGKKKFETAMNIGKMIWSEIEEEYRLNPNLKSNAEGKIIEFNRKLHSKMNCLTFDEIDEVRQAIAGEFNRAKGTLKF